MKTKACHCAAPAITGSTKCCEHCANNQEQKNWFSISAITLKKGEQIKTCSSCKHFFYLVNQGVCGCIKNHNPMDASKCEDFDGVAATYELTYTSTSACTASSSSTDAVLSIERG